MFRPVRLILFVAIAFVIGVFYERLQHSERCTNAGGSISQNLCMGAQL